MAASIPFFSFRSFFNTDFLFPFLKGHESAKTHYIHLLYFFFEVQVQHLGVLYEMTETLCVFPVPWGQELSG